MLMEYVSHLSTHRTNVPSSSMRDIIHLKIKMFFWEIWSRINYNDLIVINRMINKANLMLFRFIYAWHV